MIRAVFFDVYGTLAGFQPSRYEVQSQACADFGIKVTPEGILRGYADADAYMSEQTALRPLRLRDPKEREAFFAEYELLVLRGNGIEVSRAQALDIWRRLRRIPYEMVAFDDVVPALRQLKQRGLTLGLISNIDRDGGELAESLGLASYLDLTVTSGEVGAEKPDPAIFQAALAKARAQPSEAIHVGDQPSSDVEGARGAGISPVLLDRDGNHVRFDRCPRIESLRELPGLVGDWGKGVGG
jgi:putative hydrolase of the HAD superfamily